MNIKSLIILVISLVLLTSCNNQEVGINKQEIEFDDFRLAVYVTNSVFSVNEEIQIFLELEYVGYNDQITVKHCNPVIVGSLINSDKREPDKDVYSISCESIAQYEITFKKGVVYKYLFMPDMLIDITDDGSSESITLEQGTYQVRVFPIFEVKDRFNLLLELNFEVK